MSHALLACRFTEDAVHFSATKDAAALPVAAWPQHALHGASGALFAYHTLRQFLDKGWADAYAITLPNHSLAQCQPWELARLLLPPPPPFHLRIRPRGSLTLGDKFSVEYSLYSKARPVACTRTGILLKAEGKEYCLLDPVFSLIEKMDAYKKAPLADADARMCWWRDLLDLVSDPAIIDNAALRSYKIARAEYFTVGISLRNGLRITPRLLANPHKNDSENSEEPDAGLVSATADKRFLDTLHRHPLRSRYTLGDAYFLTL